MKQFLGTTNYGRRFMGPEFADVARPLVELTKKGATFAWSQKHSETMRNFKNRLFEYTMLQIPDPTEPYQLCTDASGYAVGTVLEQTLNQSVSSAKSWKLTSRNTPSMTKSYWL